MADDWISAHDALELLAGKMERFRAARQIKDWAGKGLIPAQAKLLWKKRPWQEPEVSTDCPLPDYFWNPRSPTSRLEADVRRIDEDWSLGNFEYWVRETHQSDGGQRYREALYQAFGVEFDRGNLLELLPPHLIPKQSKRGRPPKYAWPSVEAKVLEGFKRDHPKPESLADVERALANALRDLDAYPVESTIRRHAVTVWEGYQKAHK
jgi:hypothetical protein